MLISNIATVFLCVMLAAIIINILFTKHLFIIILNTGIVSLCSALIFIVVDAVDVAFTEAAVGAGVSTILFLIIFKIIKNPDMDRVSGSRYKLDLKGKIVISIVFLAIILIFIDVMPYIPTFGEANNPIHNNIYSAYINQSYDVFGVPNIVTMILGSFRGYDTLGETIVILTAALGVFLILISNNKIKKPKPLVTNKFEGTILNAKKEYVLTSAYFTLFPVLLLYGFYIQFHGDYGPGGGFQAGVTFATVYILFITFFNKDKAEAFISDNTLLKILASGSSLYLLTGLTTYFISGSFLNYYYLGNNYDNAYHYGLFTIELGVGLTVFAAMCLIIGQFCGKIKYKE